MKRFLFFSIILYFLVSNLAGQQILRWEEVIKEAKQKNPQLKQAEINLKQTELKIKQAEAEFYPQVSFSFLAGKNYSKNYESDINYSYNLSLGFTLFSGFSRINNLKLQLIELQIMQENYRRIWVDLISNLRENFINLYYIQQETILARKIYERRKQNYELVKLKYESGKEDLGALLRVEADMLQSEYELRKAKREKELAVRELLRNIGRDDFLELNVEEDFTVSGDVDEILKKPIEELIKETPEYKIKQYQLTKNKLQTKIAKSNFYPNVSISASYSLSDKKIIPDPDRWNLSLGLRLSYNIFNGFKDLNDLKIANINIKTAEFDLYDTKLSLINNFYSLRNSYIDDKELLTIKEKYLQALQKQAEITTVKYVNGLSTYYDWYQTEDSFINAQKNLLSLKKELILSELRLKKFLGIADTH